MTKLLEEAVAHVRMLPEDEQNRAAEVLMALAREPRAYSFSAEQIEGIHHAMAQADRGEFATDAELKEIFGRSL
jgi:predicted transcriptional regulator